MESMLDFDSLTLGTVKRTISVIKIWQMYQKMYFVVKRRKPSHSVSS